LCSTINHATEWKKRTHAQFEKEEYKFCTGYLNCVLKCK